VACRGLNDDELLDFARLTVDGWTSVFHRAHCRSWEGRTTAEFVSAKEMWETLSSLARSSHARRWRAAARQLLSTAGGQGTIGFITPVSDHFCFKCNRLRLTADGKLLPCLLESGKSTAVGLRTGASSEDIRQLILKLWPRSRKATACHREW